MATLGLRLPEAQRRSVPASTFKIASTLAALEAGLVADANAILPWDGVRRDREEINAPSPSATPFTAPPCPTSRRLWAALAPRHGSLPKARGLWQCAKR
jgi:hypothetical protein